MNSLTVVGRLTKDAEAKEKSVRLSIASNEGYDKEAQKPRVHFVDVYAVNVNEKLVPYLQKGKELLVRNATVSNRKTDNGYRTFVFVYAGNGNIQLLGGKPKTEKPKVEEKVDDDDLPF